MPAASAASTTSRSRTEPPGWMIAVDARLDRQLRAVGEREERVGGERGARAASVPVRAPSRSRAAPSRRGSSARRRCRPWRGPLDSTIALERTCLHTRQANSISPHSASVGWRSVTTSISARSSRSRSRSCTSRPPMTWLERRARRCRSGRRSSSSRMRMFGLRGEHLERLVGRSRARTAPRRTAAASASASARVDRAVERDDAAEGATRVAGERALVGLERRRRRSRRRTGCCA